MKTPEQVQAMKDEVQAWLEANDYADCCVWEDVDNHFAGVDTTLFAAAHYLVLSTDGAFLNALPGWPQGHLGKLAEFDAILDRHGCYWEHEDMGVLCIVEG